MPADAAKIELMQPRYTSAQAMLILDGNDKFYRQIPTPLSPPASATTIPCSACR